MFKGLLLETPFFRHKDDILDKYKWGYKFFNFVQFYFSFSSRQTSRPGYAEYLKKYAYHFEDPKLLHMTKLSTICFFLDEQEYARQHTGEARTPMLVVTASGDTVVRNSATKELLDQIRNPQNKLIDIAGTDHTTISIE